MGKSPPLLMVKGEVVYNISTEALEFCVRRLTLCQWARDKWFAISRAMHWSFVGQESPLANCKERSGLQHLESCTGVWLGKTPPLLLGRIEVICTIWSHALEFGWVRLPPW